MIEVIQQLSLFFFLLESDSSETVRLSESQTQRSNKFDIVFKFFKNFDLKNFNLRVAAEQAASSE